MNVERSLETGEGDTPAPSGRCHILYLIGQLGFGGSEGQLRLLLEHLDPKLFEVFVLVYHPSPNVAHDADLRRAGVHVTTMGPGGGGAFRKALLTIQHARRVRPHIIHSWTVHDNPYAALAGRCCGATLRWGSLRGSMTLCGFRSLPAFYRRMALRSVQQVVVNSGALAAELREAGLEKSRILTLPNCVDGEVFRPEGAELKAFEEYGFGDGRPVFASVGNIRRVKNQIMFVRAMAQVIRCHPEARGMVIGETLDGEEATRSALEREIAVHGLREKVVLAGFRDDVRRIMGAFTALCMTSDSEGMPNVVLEAMAAGIPVIATDVGGIAEVVRHGETGYLVEKGDVEGMAKAMGRILDEPEEAGKVAAAGRDLMLSERSCHGIARRLGSAYLEALRAAGVM